MGGVEGAGAGGDIAGIWVVWVVDIALGEESDGCWVETADDDGFATCLCVYQSICAVDVESGTGIVEIGIAAVRTVAGYDEIVSERSAIYYVWVAKS